MSSRLGEKEEDQEKDTHSAYQQEPKDPAPASMLDQDTSNDGGQSRAKIGGNHGEAQHGATLRRRRNVGHYAVGNGDCGRTSQTLQHPENKQSREAALESQGEIGHDVYREHDQEHWPSPDGIGHIAKQCRRDGLENEIRGNSQVDVLGAGAQSRLELVDGGEINVGAERREEHGEPNDSCK